MTATHRKLTRRSDVLYLAFELGERDWKLAFTVGLGQNPRLRSMAARDLAKLEAEIAKASKRFPLPPDAVPGMHVHPPGVFEVIGRLRPRRRELEITDGNRHFLDQGRLGYTLLSGYWTDRGTLPSLALANRRSTKRRRFASEQAGRTAAQRDANPEAGHERSRSQGTDILALFPLALVSPPVGKLGG